MSSQAASTSPGTMNPVEFSFPLWRRVAAPITVGVVSGALLGWAQWSRGFDLAAWLAIAVVIVLVAAEAYKRSMSVVVTEANVVERDLLGQRTLALGRLERVRLFRNTRLWLYFTGEAKPVWVLNGMGDPRAVMDLVVSRARAHGINPEVVITDKA
jgi:hypothetical protein